MHSMLVTIGLVLDLAMERQLPLDVETTTGRRYTNVLVGGVDRFCVVLMDGMSAHVVTRDHIVAVSLPREAVPELADEVLTPAESVG